MGAAGALAEPLVNRLVGLVNEGRPSLADAFFRALLGLAGRVGTAGLGRGWRALGRLSLVGPRHRSRGA